MTDDIREVTVTVLLSARERETLCKLASADHQTPTQFLRSLVLRRLWFSDCKVTLTLPPEQTGSTSF